MKAATRSLVGRWATGSVFLLILIFGMSGVVLAIWFAPPMLIEHDLELNADVDRLAPVATARQSMLWLAGGLLAVATLILTWRRDQTARQLAALDRDANFTTRYTEAIKQLGDESIAVRLGGFYALERIAFDSERDRRTALDVVAAFLRDQPKTNRDDEDLLLPVDVSAAATVLGRISRKIAVESRSSDVPARVDLQHVTLYRADWSGAHLRDALLTGVDLTSADLREVDLRGANLDAATLTDVRLSKADCRGADLSFAGLERAELDQVRMDGCRLQDAELINAKLAGSSLVGSVLVGAKLAGADLSGANLSRCDFRSADLCGSDLRGARVSGAVFAGCNWDAFTRWPEGIDPEVVTVDVELQDAGVSEGDDGDDLYSDGNDFENDQPN